MTHMHVCDRNSSIALPLGWGNNFHDLFVTIIETMNIILYISADYETVDKLITVQELV